MLQLLQRKYNTKTIKNCLISLHDIMSAFKYIYKCTNIQKKDVVHSKSPTWRPMEPKSYSTKSQKHWNAGWDAAVRQANAKRKQLMRKAEGKFRLYGWESCKLLENHRFGSIDPPKPMTKTLINAFNNFKDINNLLKKTLVS